VEVHFVLKFVLILLWRLIVFDFVGEANFRFSKTKRFNDLLIARKVAASCLDLIIFPVHSVHFAFPHRVRIAKAIDAVFVDLLSNLTRPFDWFVPLAESWNKEYDPVGNLQVSFYRCGRRTPEE
jgi:hypothetical protein